MYLSKQWRESRIITGLAILALFLLFAGALRLNYFIGSLQTNHPDPQQVANGVVGFLLGLLYTESILISFWAWLAAGIGVGKNLGEDSGSFLFTRPRRRAWFLWTDWGYAMAQIALIIAATNLIFMVSLKHLFATMHIPVLIPLDAGASASVPLLILLVSISVLLVAGLIYGITYFSTVLIKRTSGVMLGAGILLGYFILRAVMHHYQPAIHFPNLVMNIFELGHHIPHPLATGLAINIAARVAVLLAFPFAAQLLLDHTEI
jgi:hypothetical protein